MANRIIKGDTVKIIAGANKGTTGKVLSVLPAKHAALIEGVGMSHRHVSANRLNPRGGSKDIHVPVDLAKLALVTDEKSATTSRVGYSKNADGKKTRVARQQKNKEIK
jgi:large subunit ribosomal protein L24